ncbi:MAG: glutamate racemase [Prevotellaceae bacterium]|nr:glutamate racemase [Prevotellaceae bacterium]
MNIINRNRQSEEPIGMFDSGVGGISVWKELVKLLPSESVVYFADSGNCPYGPKPQEAVISLCDKIVRFLLSETCKIIVVACNTATSAAIDYLRKTFAGINFVGMEPAIKPAALNSQTGSIGILATEGTLKGRLFNETKARFASNVNVDIRVGEGLVELIEQGKTGTPEAEALLRKYIESMLVDRIDHLVLGCTHYPFLIDNIRKIAGNELLVLDPAPAIAIRTKQLLEEQNLVNNTGLDANYRFYSSGDISVLQRMLKQNIPEMYLQKISEITGNIKL